MVQKSSVILVLDRKVGARAPVRNVLVCAQDLQISIDKNICHVLLLHENCTFTHLYLFHSTIENTESNGRKT